MENDKLEHDEAEEGKVSQNPATGNEEQTENKEISRGKKIRNAIIELAIYAAIIVVCVFFVPRYVVQRTIVDGTSMENTLQNNDNLLVEKVSYHFSNPKRFDVIVFYPFGREDEDSAYYIKRVIGLPGETVQIKGDTIYINGEVLEENYGKDSMTTAGIATEPLTLGKDEFFVLGDHRSISEDSRYEEVGPVTKDKIAGRAVLRIYPFNKFGTFQ